MNIEQAKKELIKTMESIDKDKLSLAELKLYAETLKIVSEIQVKSYAEAMADVFSSSTCLGFGGYKAPTVSDMK